MGKELLSVRTLRCDYGLGRDLASRLIRLLPHIKIGDAGRGERLVVRRADVDRLLAHAATENRSLWQIARTSTPESLSKWLSEAKVIN